MTIDYQSGAELDPGGTVSSLDLFDGPLINHSEQLTYADRQTPVWEESSVGWLLRWGDSSSKSTDPSAKDLT